MELNLHTQTYYTMSGILKQNVSKTEVPASNKNTRLCREYIKCNGTDEGPYTSCVLLCICIFPSIG